MGGDQKIKCMELFFQKVLYEVFIWSHISRKCHRVFVGIVNNESIFFGNFIGANVKIHYYTHVKNKSYGTFTLVIN